MESLLSCRPFGRIPMDHLSNDVMDVLPPLKLHQVLCALLCEILFKGGVHRLPVKQIARVAGAPCFHSYPVFKGVVSVQYSEESRPRLEYILPEMARRFMASQHLRRAVDLRHAKVRRLLNDEIGRVEVDETKSAFPIHYDDIVWLDVSVYQVEAVELNEAFESLDAETKLVIELLSFRICALFYHRPYPTWCHYVGAHAVLTVLEPELAGVRQ